MEDLVSLSEAFISKGLLLECLPNLIHSLFGLVLGINKSEWTADSIYVRHLEESWMNDSRGTDIFSCFDSLFSTPTESVQTYINVTPRTRLPNFSAPSSRRYPIVLIRTGSIISKFCLLIQPMNSFLSGGGNLLNSHGLPLKKSGIATRAPSSLARISAPCCVGTWIPKISTSCQRL